MSIGLALALLAPALPYNGAECDQAEADRGVQLALNICAWRRHREADTYLNAVWDRVRDRAKAADSEAARDDKEGGYFELLLADQRAWLAYRDTQCALAADGARGGSIRPMIYSVCMEHMTLERTKALADYAYGNDDV